MLKDDLQSQLDLSVRQIVALEERVFKSNKISLDLLEDVKRLQMDVGFYHPMKLDPIDIRLGEFINASPDRAALKVLFIRDQEGLYSFGSKKCNVKIENGLKVRVGGGYLNIQEFVEQYLPIELEKLTGWDYSCIDEARKNSSPNTRKSLK